jgi:hypothetical protein
MFKSFLALDGIINLHNLHKPLITTIYYVEDTIHITIEDKKNRNAHIKNNELIIDLSSQYIKSFRIHG